MKFEYFRNDGIVAIANITMAEVIEELTDDDLILELNFTGIVLNRFMTLSAEREETKIIVWINLETEEISLTRSGFSPVQNDNYIEDIEFSMSGWDELALICNPTFYNKLFYHISCRLKEVPA